MCGHFFEPSEHTACAACPLQKGCQLVCCPVCGFETVDPNHSAAARLLMKFLGRKQSVKVKNVGKNHL
jgi:hypothetical protein